MNKRLCKYTLLNSTLFQKKQLYTNVLTQKNKKIKNIIIINWTKGPSPHMPKDQPSNVQPKTHILYHFLRGTQGFSPLQYHIQVDILGVNFLFIP